MLSLEKLYGNLQCAYHLVQDKSPGDKARPYIPALTPDGFVKLMILLIRAFPDQESSRLSRVICDLPLEAVPNDWMAETGTRERLPRQISKHLFPAQHNENALQLLTGAVRACKQATSRNSSSPPRNTQNAPPPLIHSDARSRQEHLSRYARDRGEAVVEVPRPLRSSPDRRPTDSRDERSSRYTRSHARQESPRRRRHERSGSREPERERHRRDRRWTMDSTEEGRHRHRDERGSRGR